MSNLKKNIACVAAAVFIAAGAFSKQTSERHEVRETYIAQNTPYNSFITYKELEDDIETLSYYLRTAYAGYDDMTQKGFNAEEFVRSVLKNYRGRRKSNLDKSFLTCTKILHLISPTVILLLPHGIQT